MTTWNAPPAITIELGPTFGKDTNRVRNGQVSWLNDIDHLDSEPILSVEIPLELVGAAASVVSDRRASARSPSSSLTFSPSGEMAVSGVTPDSSVRDRLSMSGTSGTGVDSLSRSVLLTDIDERTFIEAITSRTDIDAEGLAALKRDLLVPTFYDRFDDDTADKATTLLKTNIRQHERAHVRSLITPDTALWRELELYWRSILLGANPHTWTDPGFVSRFAGLYTIPSRFTNELLAMLTEEYTLAEPRVQRAVENGVAAQRGTENVLLQFIENHTLDRAALIETIRSPVGEQFCDLWVAYVLSELRGGRSLDEIDAAGFYTTCSPSTAGYDEIVRDPETRTQFIDFIRERLVGPVFELVRLTFEEGTFALERAWHSLNPGVSAAESLLAVRRVLYRREFVSTFGTASGLDEIRAEREANVERIIHGASLDNVSLCDVSHPPPDDIAQWSSTAAENAATALLGSTATPEELQLWLNDPDYGFTETATEVS
jgi:hypothetical protein